MADLSELEACVLGLVWSEAPCTPYRVHSMFQSSPSPHWSGSAGAIYPVFRKLESNDLIISESRLQGRRKSQVFKVTQEGKRALKSWLGPPVPDWVTSIPVDPLRTRLRFLGALPPGKRDRFLMDVQDQLTCKLEELQQDCRRLKKHDDPYPHAMARGAVHLTRARLRWIVEIVRAGFD